MATAVNTTLIAIITLNTAEIAECHLALFLEVAIPETEVFSLKRENEEAAGKISYTQGPAAGEIANASKREKKANKTYSRGSKRRKHTAVAGKGGFSCKSFLNP